MSKKRSSCWTTPTAEAGRLLFNFGVEGLTYTLENGNPIYTDLIMKNPDKLPLAQSMSAHFRSNFAGPFVQDKRYIEQYFQLPEQQDAYKIWQQPTNEKLMPPVTPNQDESRKFAKVMTEVNTRYDEVFAKVLTGAQPIETWDTLRRGAQADRDRGRGRRCSRPRWIATTSARSGQLRDMHVHIESALLPDVVCRASEQSERHRHHAPA